MRCLLGPRAPLVEVIRRGVCQRSFSQALKGPTLIGQDSQIEARDVLEIGDIGSHRDDPFRLGDIPSFLRRTPQPAKPADTGEAMCSTPDQEVEQ